MSYANIGLKSYIWNNNLKSIALLALFPVILLFTVWGTGFLYSFFLNTKGSYDDSNFQLDMQSAQHFIQDYGLLALLCAALWLCVAWLFHHKIINTMSAGREVNIYNGKEADALNALEALCISRGIPTPDLYVMPCDARNSFASGVDNKTYAITITTGLLDSLNTEEMEAVLAHELAHILNKDAQMIIVATVFVGMFSFLVDLLYFSLWAGATVRVKDTTIDCQSKTFIPPVAIAFKSAALMSAALVILPVGYLLNLLNRLAISKNREYVADATAVELTKNPLALASALDKIQGNAYISYIPDGIMPMFIHHQILPGDLGRYIEPILTTHPSIRKRIAVLKKMA